MEETARTEARNYLSAAGFFLLASYYILSLLYTVGNNGNAAQSFMVVDFIVGIGLLIIATLLIILRKRDIIALTFVMFGFLKLFSASASSTIGYLIIALFLLLVALVTLTAKEKQKWLLFLLPLIMVLWIPVGMIFGDTVVVDTVFRGLLFVVPLYYAFCCASERFHLPGSKLLTSDESTDFKASGSVLGYMLFALTTAGYTLYYIIGNNAVFPLETLVTMEMICGSLMIFVAILLFAVGKMRFTPVMFLLIGLTNLLSIYSGGVMFIGIGILFIVIGLVALLRKESRILPGIMLIVYGCTAFFSAYTEGATVSAPVVSVILNIIPCLIAIYLAFAVYSQRKLPKF